MSVVKRAARQVLPSPVFDTLKAVQRHVQFSRASGFSETEPNIHRWVSQLPLTNHFAVDIAGKDGIQGSQTLGLFKAGWNGLVVECDARMFHVLSQFYRAFEHVSLIRTMVNPENAVALLDAAGCPRDFAFLSLDIDSYDYFILERILGSYRPSLICAEINETIPPPLSFTVRYAPGQMWAGDHFQGQSISRCHELCEQHSYDIVELHYNNLLLVARELNSGAALTPMEAYETGYRARPDRRQRFPGNADMEELIGLPPAEAITFLNRKFAQYHGKYELR